MKRRSKAEGIKDVVLKVIRKIEKQDPGKKETISKVWKDTVGEKAARHTRPVGIKRKVLAIEVDSSTWLYDLNLKKRDLVKDLKKKLAKYKIEDIRFRMGDIT